MLDKLLPQVFLATLRLCARQPFAVSFQLIYERTNINSVFVPVVIKNPQSLIATEGFSISGETGCAFTLRERNGHLCSLIKANL
jgi:hypothetical protein